jgi:hypothetical protein
VWLVPDEDVQRLAFLDEVAFFVVGECDPDLASAESQ